MLALILEILTTTFYGLALSIAAFSVALFVYVTKDNAFSSIHALLFLIVAVISTFLLQKFLRSHSGITTTQGVERYIWEKRNIKQTWSDLKISLDGVDYPVDSDAELSVGDRVEVVGCKGVSMKVKRLP